MPHQDDAATRIVRVDRALRLYRKPRRKVRVGLQGGVDLRDVEPGLDRIQEGEETGGIIARILHLAGNKFEREGGGDIAAHLEHSDDRGKHDQGAQALHILV